MEPVAAPDVTQGRAGGFGWNMVRTGLFGVSAVLLWRRAGWERCRGGFRAVDVGKRRAYIVLAESHMHGYFGELGP